MKCNIVIVGGGIAAVSAVKAIREFDKDANISMICEEPFYPYIRIKLSKGMFDSLEEEKILVQKKGWYEENNVNINVGKKAVKIKTETNEVILSDGSSVKYDKLLLATGAENNKPPIDGIDKKGVFTLRTLKNALEIRKNVEENIKILNIGGGVQNLELAWILHKNGKEVSVAEFQQRLMPNQLDVRASEILQKAAEASGVKIYLNTAVDKILGEDKVTSVLTKDKNEIECQVVLYATGIKPNINLLKDTALKTNRGVVVNGKMETNIENIYAAGDVAEVNGRNIGLWTVSTEQGKIAGYNIAGREAEYKNQVPTTNLNAFNISVFSMGIVDEKAADLTIDKDEAEQNKYIRIFIKDNKIIGAIVIGDVKCSQVIKKAIEKQTALNSINLSDTSFDGFMNKLINI